MFPVRKSATHRVGQSAKYGINVQLGRTPGRVTSEYNVRFFKAGHIKGTLIYCITVKAWLVKRLCLAIRRAVVRFL